MNKPISRKTHGFTDYSYIPLALTAPVLFDFEDDERARLAGKIQAGSILLSTLFTRAEWGLFKTMSYKKHLIIDVAVGVFSVAAPWLFGFSENKKARNAFLILSGFNFSAGLLSKPEEMTTTDLIKNKF
ncbi:MAG: hypothetical protein EOP42_10935 [Sphingobacteriaceae bacterium]|nr:MAG: hypothetical protein EOP42_10935 [Sphingobacteriaceae bacterium]